MMRRNRELVTSHLARERTRAVIDALGMTIPSLTRASSSVPPLLRCRRLGFPLHQTLAPCRRSTASRWQRDDLALFIHFGVNTSRIENGV